ncbi:MAG: polysaccharide biosynthesis tyrosine autokinase [Proteobacteria bacterium]|nr:polysaccharide biosynthesis tyrosine autokinase [Pseudomonadota bacterium]
MQTSNNDHDYEEFEEQEIHLRDYFRIIRKRKYLIFTVLIIVFLATVVKTFTTIPVYTAASQVLIEKNYGNKGLDYQYQMYDPGFISTQSEIIKSANVALKVVDNLQLAKKYHHYFFKEKGDVSLVDVAKKYLKVLIEPVIKFFEKDQKEVIDTSETNTIVTEPKTDKETIAQIIRGGLGVEPLDDTKIVSISYSDLDPAMARLVTDAIVRAYKDEMLEIKLSTSSYSVKWMTDKAQEEREKLEYSEHELQNFMRENDLVTVEDKLTILPQKLSEFGRQISKAEALKKELHDQLSQIRNAGKDLNKLESIPTLASNEVLKSIRDRIYKTTQTIQELSKKYGHKHPKMIKVTDELRILNDEKRYEINRILSTITNSYDLATSKEKSMKELLAQTKNEMLGSNEKFMQYQIMKRQVDSNRVMYETLQAGIKKEGVTEQSQSVNIWVIKKADLPTSPSKPNKKRNLLLGLILGIFSGVGLAFFIEYLDNTVKGAQELEEKFGLTVLGSIEELRGKDKNIESFVTQNPHSPVTESYRLVRSGLLLSSAERPPKTMLITSMNAKEGKTSTTANIGRILAQAGSSVLVIDCDLRRPRMHEIIGDKSDIGLSSFLSGSSEEDIIQETKDKDVFFIPSGPIPPSPAELLGSAKMKNLIESLSGKFDFILLDSPPVQSVTDSLMLSQYVDGTIIVVRAGKTTNEDMESGMKKLHDVQTHFLGFVLNGMKTQDMGNYYYGYSTYYAKDEA